MDQLVQHVIGGKRVTGASSRRADVFNPATGQVARKVVLGTRTDVDAAVEAATAALPGWAATAPLSRARVLFKLRDLLESHAKELSAVITAEHGKVLSDAIGEVTRGHRGGRVRVRHSRAAQGRVHRPGRRAASIPIRCASRSACVAGITPFNFPAMVPLWMCARRDRLRQQLHSEAVRARSVGVAAHGRAVPRGRAAGGRVQRRATATRKRSTRSWSIRASRQ